MAQGWMEELVDNLLYLGLIMGLLIFSVCYWKEDYQLRLAELTVEEFLQIATADGRISAEEYEGLVLRLNRLDAEYEAELTRLSYELQPCYALIPQQELDTYYMERNVRKEIALTDKSIIVTEVDASKLKLQEETNASLMAAGKQEYLPLPEEGTVWSAEAVRPWQEVYAGETLITLCKIVTEEGSYYAEAEPMAASETGTVWLELAVEEGVQYVPVEVLCHPRVVMCVNGHELVNTKEIVETWKQTGVICCPYCAAYPAGIQCQTKLLYRETGRKLGKEELWLEVCYLDGHTEQITPDSEEWQDNYDETYCGIQLVTIRYRGLEETVTIVSENGACRKCAKACNERSYVDYVKFPYCTECMSKVPLFTGQTYYEEQEMSFAELVAGLEENGEVLLNLGDYITITLKKDGTYKSILQRMVKRDGRSGDTE